MGNIIGLGEALWDMLPEGKRIGGAPANFAYHCMQFGHKATAVSAVGKDELGKKLVEQLKARGLELEMPAIDFPTGVVKISLTEDGIPDYDICRNVAWDYIPFTPEMNQLAQSADAVCFGSLAQRFFVSRDCISRFLDIMRGNCNTLRVFDLNLRQDFYDCNIVGNSLHCCNVVKLNDEELPIVVRMFSIKGDSAKQQCRNLMERFGLKMAILTCGTRGSYIFAQDTTSFVETPLVEVADTVGAGDSFSGAFIGSLLNGKTIHDAHTTAVRISAYVCTQNGAMPDIPRSLTI